MIITLVAALTGALVGLLLWSRLRTPACRRPYDDVDDVNELDRRPTHRWVLLLMPATWAWLTLALSPNSRWAVLLWLPMGVALTWGSAVDLDVRRLPNRSLAAVGLWTSARPRSRGGGQRPAAAVGGSCCGRGRLRHDLLRAAFASRGGLGLGDVKLVAVLAAASAGTAGWPTVVALILLGCLIALIGMAATHRRDIAFGPCLTLAVLIVVGVAVRF